MQKALTLAAWLVLASSSFAQQTMQAQRIPGRLRDAGVYHVGTRTWTHGGDTLTPPKVLYRNIANTGFFGVMWTGADILWTDEGCMPSPGHESGAKSGSQTVQSITLRYCSSVNGPQVGGIAFYDAYTSCTEPLSLPVAGGFGFVAPGGASGGTACWVATFDLSGTTFEFDLTDDSDGVFDGTTALDSFGWTLFLADGGAGGFNGPFLDGDPNNVPYGDGTYYQNTASTYGTGLDTLDQFWMTDTSGSYANGCYWFGGYTGGNPFASWSVVLRGKSGGSCFDCGGYVKYCVANNNSTGAPADLSASGSGSSAAGNLVLTSAPIPNQNSIFFHGANEAQLPFGCGFQCATGNIIRGAITPGVGNSASYTYDNSDTRHSLGAFIGTVRSFQHWYRDPMGAGICGGQTFNTSNAISISILP
jgi:hypothetical protein